MVRKYHRLYGVERPLEFENFAAVRLQGRLLRWNRWYVSNKRMNGVKAYGK